MTTHVMPTIAEFAFKYPGWHSYSKTCSETAEAVCAAHNLGIVEVNEHHQFRLRSEKKARSYININTRLRYSQGNIETSRGAKVQLDDAKRFIKGVQLIIQDMERKGLAFIKPDVPQSVGHFSLRSISFTDRCVAIGCHSLHFDEINAFIDFAKQHQPELEITDEYKIDV